MGLGRVHDQGQITLPGGGTERGVDLQLVEFVRALRRAGTPEEIAKVAAFLASDESSYITGEAINITGGSWNV